jgi:hypothetical protein
MEDEWEEQNIITSLITYDILGILIIDKVHW